ncbi:MAG TPA: cytochrome c [Pyrinomonadaceae bacterium]|nr:cytochrome c [Pyrinomonadaceae bacterium]
MKRKAIPAMIFALVLALVSTELYATRSVHHSTASQTSTAQTAVDASLLFDKHCDTCHGKDGRAKTFKAKFNHARNLTDSKWQAEVTDERIYNSIANGKGKMPAWGKKLNEGQINALVAYVRGLKR